MPSFTTELKGRNPDKLKLSEEEAWNMLNAGFRFSLFDPTTDDYRLSSPYRLAHNLTRGTITLEQR